MASKDEFAFDKKTKKELEDKLKKLENYNELKPEIDEILNKFLEFTKTINTLQKHEDEIFPRFPFYTDTTNAFILSKVKGVSNEQKIKDAIENMADNKEFLDEIYKEYYEYIMLLEVNIPKAPDMFDKAVEKENIPQTQIDEITDIEKQKMYLEDMILDLIKPFEKAMNIDNINETLKSYKNLSNSAKNRLRYILFLQHFKKSYEEENDRMEEEAEQNYNWYILLFMLLILFFVYKSNKKYIEKMNPFTILVVLIIAFTLYNYSTKKKELYIDKLLYDKTRRNNLLKELSTTNFLYKKVTVDKDGHSKSSYVNLSEDLILLLETNEIYLPYVEFIVKLYKFRNKNYPSSKNSCYKFFDSFFQNMTLLMVDSISKEEYFEETVPGIYETNASHIFKKKKTPFTRMDLSVLELIVQNKDNFNGRCKNENMQELFVIHFSD